MAAFDPFGAGELSRGSSTDRLVDSPSGDWTPGFDAFADADTDAAGDSAIGETRLSFSRLSQTVFEPSPPPEVPDPTPYSKKLELPANFVPFEQTIASTILSEFCRNILGYEPVYSGGKGDSVPAMPALNAILGVRDAALYA